MINIYKRRASPLQNWGSKSSRSVDHLRDPTGTFLLFTWLLPDQTCLTKEVNMMYKAAYLKRNRFRWLLNFRKSHRTISNSDETLRLPSCWAASDPLATGSFNNGGKMCRLLLQGFPRLTISCLTLSHFSSFLFHPEKR